MRAALPRPPEIAGRVAGDARGHPAPLLPVGLRAGDRSQEPASARPFPEMDRMTDRSRAEDEVRLAMLRLRDRGLTTREIAKRLGLRYQRVTQVLRAIDGADGAA